MDETSIEATSSTAVVPDMDELVRKAVMEARQLASLKEATSSFVRRDAKLSQLRERTLLLRSRAKFEWKNCHDYRRFVRQSQEAFNDEAAAMMSPPGEEDYEARLERLRNLHDQVVRDFDAQNEYAERANALQTELGDLEYELQTKELSVKKAADLMKTILNELVLPGDSSAATAVETEVPPTPSTPSSNELNPLVENYFQKAGLVNNLVEQSIDLEVDYADARAERDFKAEHDQAVDSSEEAFEALWQQRRDEKAYELTEARQKAETARNVCLDDGLEPDKHRKRPRRDSDRSMSDSLPDEIAHLLPPDLDIQVLEDNGYFPARTSSDYGMSVFPVFTPEALPTRKPREPGPEVDTSAPLTDRVLDWIYDVDGPTPSISAQPSLMQRPNAFPRRSKSVS